MYAYSDISDKIIEESYHSKRKPQDADISEGMPGEVGSAHARDHRKHLKQEMIDKTHQFIGGCFRHTFAVYF